MGKIKLEIIIPVVIAVILVAVFIYLDFKSKNQEPGTEPSPGPGTQSEIVTPSENSKRNQGLIPNIDYGCAGPASINLTTLKQPDSVWKISKEAKTISLGKYRINPSQYIILDIPKLWLYFRSEKLSNREDNWYGLEKSYVSGMVLRVNGHEREIKLGGDEYMFIELSDYPLGDYYPYENMDLEFEFLIELKCKNLENGACLNNENKPLDYINNADIKSQIRIFARGCQEFTKDIIINANFEY